MPSKRHRIRRTIYVSIIAMLIAALHPASAQAVLAPRGTISAAVHPYLGYSNMLFSFQSNADGFIWQGYIPEGQRWGEPNYPSYNSEPQRMWVNGYHTAYLRINTGYWNCLDGGTTGISWNVHPGSGYVGDWRITAYLVPDSNGRCHA